MALLVAVFLARCAQRCPGVEQAQPEVELVVVTAQGCDDVVEQNPPNAHRGDCPKEGPHTTARITTIGYNGTMATTKTPRIDTTRITAFRADLDVRHRGATLGDGQQVARPLALILDGRVVIEGTVAELRQLLLDSLQQLEIAEITALLAAVSH